jgi:hypothetical protein
VQRRKRSESNNFAEAMFDNQLQYVVCSRYYHRNHSQLTQAHTNLPQIPSAHTRAIRELTNWYATGVDYIVAQHCRVVVQEVAGL